jgi:NADPH2:quinone reductase
MEPVTHVRAAVVEALGAPPRVVDRDVPVPTSGEVLVEMVAAALNPMDLAVWRGTFWAGHPSVPYVPAAEAVGRVVSDGADGPLVFAYGGDLGVARDGTASELFVAPRDVLIDVPPAVDPAVAAALGTAGLAGWLPITWRARAGPGDVVLVLGATGTAGRVALDAARSVGAERVVAAGRDRERLDAVSALADATVWLGGDDLSGALARACGGEATVIYDPLFGQPLEAALAVAARGARIVHVGASASPTATLPSALIRGRSLSILGFANRSVPREVVVEAYRTMARRAADGVLSLDVVTTPLDRFNEAWAALERGSVKQVVVPR